MAGASTSFSLQFISMCFHISPLKALTSKVVEAVRSVEIKINLAEILDGQAAQKDHLDRAQMVLCMISTCWWLCGPDTYKLSLGYTVINVSLAPQDQCLQDMQALTVSNHGMTPSGRSVSPRNGWKQTSSSAWTKCATFSGPCSKTSNSSPSNSTTLRWRSRVCRPWHRE